MTTEDVLGRIVAMKRAAAARRGAVPQGRVKLDSPGHTDGPPATRSPRGFAERLLTMSRASAGPAVIAEVKRRSPSGGEFPHQDIVSVAIAYERAGAAAISVLTESDHFGGSMDDVEAVRRAVKVPVLRKDFLIDESDVVESATCGADAVLLIAEILDDDALDRMLAAAREAGLDALVEAHTAEQAERAVSAGATIVGINNRDLRSLRTDLGTALAVLPLLRSRVPLLVAESGIKTTADLLAVRSAGADAALVGESLLRAADPGGALAALLGLP